jgi:hypothetical protein
MTYTIPGFRADPRTVRAIFPGRPSPETTSARVVSDDYTAEDLCDTLLAAMVILAAKSKRRQADLSAALRRMNLPVTAEQIMAALHKLREEGCVQDWVPLYDGGMLVSITNRGMDETGRIGSWRFLEQIHTLRP